MNEYKRMAAILLILIFAIADLSLTVLKDFEESGIKRDRRYLTDTVDAIGEQDGETALGTCISTIEFCMDMCSQNQ